MLSYAKRGLLPLLLGAVALAVFAQPALAAPSLTGLSLDPATIEPNGHTTATVTISEPAPVGGVTIALAASPSTGVSMPASVLIPQDETSADFTVTDLGTSSLTTITASLDASLASADLHTSSGSGLVVNEVDYDEPGTDTGEFVEIYNPSASTISLDGLALVLVNGADGHEYGRVSLGSGSLASGGFLVVGDNAVGVPVGVDLIHFSSASDNIQNGAPDGVALIDTSSNVLLDALSYEGSITAAQIIGFPGPVSLVEGTPLPPATADSATQDASLGRDAAGTDTNDAASDWHFFTTPTPGAANGDGLVDHAPVLDAIGPKSGVEGSLLSFVVSATDPDGDSLSYSASNLPPGASFDTGTRTFSWTPVAGQAGTHPGVHFTVSDGTLTNFEDVTITVAPAQGTSTPPGTAPSPAPSPQPVHRKKCKKPKKHHRALAAKKKCKKKRR